MDRRRALGAHLVSFAIAGALPALPSAAREADAAPPPSCWKATEAAARDACAAAEYAEADRLLNAAYRRAMDGSDPARRTALRGAQRAWLAYRDAQVLAAFSRRPSLQAGRSACESALLARMTEARTAELKAFAEPLHGEALPDEACAPAQAESSDVGGDASVEQLLDQLATPGDEPFQNALRVSQRAWLAYRDAHLASVVASVPAAAAAASACRQAVLGRMTVARFARLATLRENPVDAAARCARAADEAALLADKGSRCKAGEMSACWYLGYAHDGGYHGQERNPWRALEWYERACDGGYPRACSWAALAYEKGRGAPRNLPRAIALLRKSCDGGDAAGCDSLAWAHAKGSGVPKDPARAGELWQRACDVDKPEPGVHHEPGRYCRNLAVLLEAGEVLPADPARALALHLRACAENQPGSCLSAARLLRKEGSGANTSRIVSLYEAACSGYDTREACVELGDMYREGDGVPRDTAAALSAYRSACDASFVAGCRAARALAGEPTPGDPDDPIAEGGYLMTLRLQIHESLPPVRLRLFGDDYGVVSRIDVYDPGKQAVTQQLLVEADAQDTAEPPPRGVPSLRAADLDFDGYQDLLLLSWRGATGNKGHLVWMFEPGRRTFVFNRELSGLSNLTPHPAEKVLTTFSTGGHAGAICTGETYRWKDGQPVAVRRVSQDWDEKAQAYVRVIEERQQSRLVIVRRETRPIDKATVTVERFAGGRPAAVETRDDDADPGPACWVPENQPPRVSPHDTPEA